MLAHLVLVVLDILSHGLIAYGGILLISAMIQALSERWEAAGQI